MQGDTAIRFLCQRFVRAGTRVHHTTSSRAQSVQATVHHSVQDAGDWSLATAPLCTTAYALARICSCSSSGELLRCRAEQDAKGTLK